MASGQKKRESDVASLRVRNPRRTQTSSPSPDWDSPSGSSPVPDAGGESRRQCLLTLGRLEGRDLGPDPVAECHDARVTDRVRVDVGPFSVPVGPEVPEGLVFSP